MKQNLYDCLFTSVPDDTMNMLYDDILSGRKTGLKPVSLEPYIKRLEDEYHYDLGIAWKQCETAFYEEVAKRFFRMSCPTND